MSEEREPRGPGPSLGRVMPVSVAGVAAKPKRWRPVAGAIVLVCSVAGFLVSLGLCGVGAGTKSAGSWAGAGVVVLVLSLGLFLIGLVIAVVELVVWLVLKARGR